MGAVRGALDDQQFTASHVRRALVHTNERFGLLGAAAEQPGHLKLVELEQNIILRGHVGAEGLGFQPETLASMFGQLFPTRIAKDQAVELLAGGLGILSLAPCHSLSPGFGRPPLRLRHRRLPYAQREKEFGCASGGQHRDGTTCAVADDNRRGAVEDRDQIVGMLVEPIALSASSQRPAITATVVHRDWYVAEPLHNRGKAFGAVGAPVHQHYWRTGGIDMMAHDVKTVWVRDALV